MELSKIQRVKKLCRWLIYAGYADNESELALVLGYTKSSFSQFLNEKKPLTDKFLDKICALDPNINKVYITDGTGVLLHTPELQRTEELLVMVSNQQELIGFQKKEIEQLKSEITYLRGNPALLQVAEERKKFEK